MSKKKNLNEDLKRFNLLMEYDFYIGEEEEEILPTDEIITEEPPEGEAPEGDLEPEMDDAGGEEMDMEEPMDDTEDPFGDEEMTDPDAELEPDAEFGGEDMGEPLPPPEPMEDEVELDVTELVQGTEAAKQSADQANQQIGALMAKFEDLTNGLSKMDDIAAKIDGMEHEIEKRNPTPDEQLELRSLDSFPYSLKLTDYWDEKEGNYDAMGKDDNGDTEEFTLTQDEVDEDYNHIHVKDSFSDSGAKDETPPIKY